MSVTKWGRQKHIVLINLSVLIQLSDISKHNLSSNPRILTHIPIQFLKTNTRTLLRIYFSPTTTSDQNRKVNRILPPRTHDRTSVRKINREIKFLNKTRPPKMGTTWRVAILVFLFGLALGCDDNDVAAYKVTLRTLWSEETFPKDYPQYRPRAQWSPVFGK